jgi:general secretion pathway protein G
MKRAFTLLEIMIVILLITIISGAIGYNMKGTLEKGRAFRTERAKDQLHDILLYCYAEKKDMDQIMKNLEKEVKDSGLAKDPKELLKDGWGIPFKVRPNVNKTDFIIYSEKYAKYKNLHKDSADSSSNIAMDEDEED